MFTRLTIDPQILFGMSFTKNTSGNLSINIISLDTYLPLFCSFIHYGRYQLIFKMRK